MPIMTRIPTPEVTEYDLSACACDDDFVQAFREAFESGDVLKQIEELDTLEAMELSC
jgi:hypothetical protein